MHGRYGSRVTNPQVDGLGLAVKGNASKGNIALYMTEQGGVFVSEVVIFYCSTNSVK